MGKIQFRAFMTDSLDRKLADQALPTSVARSGGPPLPAMRRELARFKGKAISAEREAETGDLVVYLLSTGPIPTDVFGDSAACGCDGPHQRVDAKRMQELSEASRKRAAGR
jgi:hypothetical protein